MRATLSILGLYEMDNTILDPMLDNLPKEMEVSPLNRENVKQAIFQECAELELVITRPSLLKTLIGWWAARKSYGWQRYYDAIHTTYSPLENYNRYEEEEEEEGGTQGATSDTTTETDETTRDTRTPGLTTEKQVSAFNSANYAPAEKTTETGTDTTAGTRGLDGSASTETSGEYSRERGRTSHIHGNIGVTTSQQMLKSELELTPDLDMYAVIVNDFKKEFCIMVY